jgi:hypothetical protein
MGCNVTPESKRMTLINACSVKSGNARIATKIISEMLPLCDLRDVDFSSLSDSGYAVVQLFEALRYKPEVRGFDFRMSHWDISMP